VVRAIAFSLDSKKVSSALNDYTVRLWDSTRGASQQILNGYSGWQAEERTLDTETGAKRYDLNAAMLYISEDLAFINKSNAAAPA
jgi:WD40 repeat protein